MKKILVLLFLTLPLLANAQLWFKANAVRYAGDVGEYSEWKNTDIKVFFGDDLKVKIYAKEIHILRRIGGAIEDVDKNGIQHRFWQAVDEESQDIIVCVSTDRSTFMHLNITFAKNGYRICYNLVQD